MPSSSPSRLDFLDGLRGLLALCVSAYHCYETYSEVQGLGDNGRTANELLRGMHFLKYGASAVSGFIVLSGYCLMLPIVRSKDGRLRGGTMDFFRRRAVRILPPYYGALLLSLLVIAYVPGLRPNDHGAWRDAFWHVAFPAFTPGVLISHLLLVHNYRAKWQYAIDYPMWSIATEAQIYLLFPAMVAIWRRWTMDRVVINALRMTLLQLGLVVFSPDLNPWPPQFLTLFALGMAAAGWHHPRPTDAPPKPLPWGWLAGGLFALYLLIEVMLSDWIGKLGHQQLRDFSIGGAVVCLVLYCGDPPRAARRPWILRALESDALVGLGRFSYSLYLIHAPILAVWYVVLHGANVSPAMLQIGMLTLGLGSSVLVSYLFYRVFERPFVSNGIGARFLNPARVPAQ